MADLKHFLSERQILSSGDLNSVAKQADGTDSSLIDHLIRSSILTPGELADALAEYFDIPRLKTSEWPAEECKCDYITAEFMKENRVVPLFEARDTLAVAMANPGDSFAQSAVKLAANRQLDIRVAGSDEIEAAIQKHYVASEPDDPWDAAEFLNVQNEEDIEQLKDLALETPIVRYVNQLFRDAIHLRATDIHIEPFDRHLSIRIRVDGLLRDLPPPPAHYGRAIISRIKILSGLNIAERRLPQDGRARLKFDNQKLDLRIATVPTIHGETMAIRLLDNVRRTLDFSKLGFTEQQEQQLLRNLAKSHGLIIVTGPTGSGKTTTLATSLSLLNESHRKILTVEDPIEYELDGVNQTQVKPQIGYDFATALRSFLRHDPDVIMVGEIRDGETARIAIQAALTGHVVLSSLHTNTASGAVVRLLDMGVDSYLLSSSLRCVVGQRLVRQLCQSCRIAPEDKQENLNLIEEELPYAWSFEGCDLCSQTGYVDRSVIAEVLEVDDDIRSIIRPDVSAHELETLAIENGMIKILDTGLEKCRTGLTTLDEVRRVASEL